MEDVKLFGKYAYSDVDFSQLDPALVDYISVHEKQQVMVPHTAGRYVHKRFQKVSCPLVERLCNHLMSRGRNTGKKLLAIRIVEHAFDIIAVSTGQNPIVTFVKGVQYCGAREDSTRIGVGGTVRRQACDVSPLRRIDQALSLITEGVRKAAFRSSRNIAECLADELIAASNNDQTSYACRKKDELERIAKSNR
ncbi:40S ribosomal protein S5, putative [Trichomonas vaginalis G3]|uniref:40S ribosomal protein S5, putative n=1 Tax=Trichomonas vaginalis (strain ATCC PRA-98 / G3) TaxID=412133 RepID=A2FPT8_TRIV3|nr:Chain F 40s Ribosomal Protein S5-b [Trichomonas vaginalis G3]EAX93081.1 40S ribosomal protein S5, putative [Trichomonas vaginalis G3]KAI5502689.1 Chain F 40s Ribosomal Protein S5-b [Trichomonas vaginalis G3]|eukprot:XP_001306011.1 40S ribosomal protein S5 [Trichomonas vaginalis G3]